MWNDVLPPMAPQLPARPYRCGLATLAMFGFGVGFALGLILLISATVAIAHYFPRGL